VEEMKQIFKVIDTRTGEDVSHHTAYYWMIDVDGNLRYELCDEESQLAPDYYSWELVNEEDNKLVSSAEHRQLTIEQYEQKAQRIFDARKKFK
jgi:hypothetical protein